MFYEKQKVNIDYIDRVFHEEYKTFINKSYLIDKIPTIKSYENAIMLPRKYNQKTLCYEGGICDFKGNYILESAVPQENFMNGKYTYNADGIKKIEKTVIYGGLFIAHWGHFLVDVLPRLWWVLEEINYEELIFTEMWKCEIDGNILEVFEVLGISKEKIKIVKEPIQYKEIIVPEPSLLRPKWYTKKFQELLCFIQSKADVSMVRYKKVYFTRTTYEKAKKTEINERIIERFFKANGYAIISPEKLTFRQQLSLYTHCKEFVSIAGTIPHNIIFCNKEARWTILNKCIRINTIQIILNKLSNCQVTYIDAFIQPFPVNPSTGPYWLDFNQNMVKYANDYKLIIKKNYDKKRKGMFIRTLDLITYCLLYFSIKDEKINHGETIMSKTRLDEETFPQHKIYFYYRKNIGNILNSLNLFKIVRIYIQKIKSLILKKGE